MDAVADGYAGCREIIQAVHPLVPGGAGGGPVVIGIHPFNVYEVDAYVTAGAEGKVAVVLYGGAERGVGPAAADKGIGQGISYDDATASRDLGCSGVVAVGIEPGFGAVERDSGILYLVEAEAEAHGIGLGGSEDGGQGYCQ